MQIVFRHLAKVWKISRSLIVTLPQKMCLDLGITKGDQVAIYQLEGAIVIYPLKDLPNKGAPAAIDKAKRLIRTVAL